MPYIDGAAIRIQPTDRYFEWACSLGGPDAAEIDRDDFVTAYVVSAPPEEDAPAILRRCYAEIFEYELHAWHTDRAQWPQERSYAEFLEWFDAEVIEMVAELDGTGPEEA